MRKKDLLNRIEYYDDESYLLDENFLDDSIDIGSSQCHMAERFEKNGKYGVMLDGNVIISANYDKILLLKYDSYDTNFIVIACKSIENSNILKWGIISERNEIIEECIYDNIYWFTNSSSIKLKIAEDYYAINLKNGINRIKIENYSYIGDFQSFKLFADIPLISKYLIENKIENLNYAIVRTKDKCGFITDKGEILIKPEKFIKLERFALAEYNKELKLWAKAETEDKKHVSIDYRGYYWGIISSRFTSPIKINTDRYVVKDSNNKYGIIDSSNNIICNFIYDEYVDYCRSFWSSPNNKKIIMGCDKGKVLIDIESGNVVSQYYDSLSWLQDSNYCHAGINGKYGVIDENGLSILPCIYDKLYGVYIVNNKAQSKDVIYNGEHGVITNSEFLSDDSKSSNSFKNILSNEDNYHIPNTKSTYEKYSGTYAQDEAGYSDDDIDTIFEGDASAYWNID